MKWKWGDDAIAELSVASSLSPDWLRLPLTLLVDFDAGNKIRLDNVQGQ